MINVYSILVGLVLICAIILIIALNSIDSHSGTYANAHFSNNYNCCSVKVPAINTNFTEYSISYDVTSFISYVTTSITTAKKSDFQLIPNEVQCYINLIRYICSSFYFCSCNNFGLSLLSPMHKKIIYLSLPFQQLLLKLCHMHVF